VPVVDWGVTPAPLALGQAEILRHGDGPLMIWAYGSAVKSCHDALLDLGAAAAGITLVDARFAKPLDADLLTELAKTHSDVLTVEDHVLPGGFGAIVAAAASDRGLPVRVYRAGIRDELVPHAQPRAAAGGHGP
jgi:1-deoxy-D-xylulose-5-phosphate synthase